MITKKYMQSKLQQMKQFIRIHVLHADDSPHRIALGAALGLFVAWSPLLGLHTWIVLLLCIIFRANKLIALMFIWVSNPFTFVPIYYPSYLLGKTLLKAFHYETNQELSDAQFYHLLNKFTLLSGFTNIFHIKFWQSLFEFLWEKGLELSVGSFVIGLLVALTGYFVTYHLTIWYRKTYSRRHSSNC